MYAMVTGTAIAYVPATVPCDLGTHMEYACIPRMYAMVAGTTVAYVRYRHSTLQCLSLRERQRDGSDDTALTIRCWRYGADDAAPMMRRQ